MGLYISRTNQTVRRPTGGRARSGELWTKYARKIRARELGGIERICNGATPRHLSSPAVPVVEGEIYFREPLFSNHIDVVWDWCGLHDLEYVRMETANALRIASGTERAQY